MDEKINIFNPDTDTRLEETNTDEIKDEAIDDEFPSGQQVTLNI